MSAAAPSAPRLPTQHDPRNVQGSAGQHTSRWSDKGKRSDQVDTSGARSTATRVASARRMSPRLATMRQFANAALDQDRLTLFPLALGELTDDERNMVLDCYLQAADATRFEPLAPSMVMPDGWQTLLGPKAMLVTVLRHRLCIDYRSGSHRPWVEISEQELADLIGCSRRTIVRWFSLMQKLPPLDVVLDDYKKHLEARDALSRRKKPALDPLQCALLRLFLPRIEHTDRPAPEGSPWTSWNSVLRIWVSPINPLTLREEQAFLAALREAEILRGDTQESASASPSPDAELARDGEDHEDHEGASDERGGCTGSTESPDEEIADSDAALVAVGKEDRENTETEDDQCGTMPQQRQNVVGGMLGRATPAATKCRRSASDCQIQTDNCYSGGEPPHPSAKRRRAEAGRRSYRMRARRRITAIQAFKVSLPRFPVWLQPVIRTFDEPGFTGYDYEPSRTVQKRSGKRSIAEGTSHTPTVVAFTETSDKKVETARAHDEQAGWYATHADEIAAYRRLACRYLADFHLGDRAPASTATRVARLLAGARIPFEQVGAVLSQAYHETYSRRGSHLVRREGTVFRRAPRFLRILQELLGNEQNPAYLPSRSRYGKARLRWSA